MVPVLTLSAPALSSWNLISNYPPATHFCPRQSPGKPKATHWQVTSTQIMLFSLLVKHLNEYPTKVSAILSFRQLRSSTKWWPIWGCITLWYIFLCGEITQWLIVPFWYSSFSAQVWSFSVEDALKPIYIHQRNFIEALNILTKYYDLHKTFSQSFPHTCIYIYVI